jgi:hypothetical protein
VREKPVVDQGCLIAVAPFGVPGTCDRILYNGNLEALLEELPQMGFDAHIRQHPAQNNPRYRPLTELQAQVVRLRPKYLMRADDNCLTVFDASQSAPEFSNPARLRGPLRANVRVLNSSASRGPLNFHCSSVG